MVDFYYDVTLQTNIPHGSSILDKQGLVYFADAQGKDNPPWPCATTVFAWPVQNAVRLKSELGNIATLWNNSASGRLTIMEGFHNVPTFAITGLARRL